jgi:hypothetical protein
MTITVRTLVKVMAEVVEVGCVVAIVREIVTALPGG